MKFSVGQKIKFKSEKQRYTVVGASERYLICTKPFNPRKTYIYDSRSRNKKKRARSLDTRKI